ncbi:hypothetical protein PIB30_039670 [Stylosanthes scabra]|uniref:Uncharacterized protein n=1 Tax=Stylosanthes scabra TaxID=79078 RepID=A0ABU6VD45_9FABA|nr:hypothetical protein [Stylosanthes scabra]
MVLQKSSSSPSIVFQVRRNPAEIVAPAGPTPHELKLLSDIDDQQGLRIYHSAVQFFPYQASMAGKDPVHVIREALSKALVFYYPLAGRLREGPTGKLMVDCTAQGVLFIEADADVTLDQFGVDLLPPFPCFHELLYHAAFPNNGIINSPLLLIQVTRLKCGGFIFAMRVNHTMCDGCGTTQFIKAIAEIAQGAAKPSIMPVWLNPPLPEGYYGNAFVLPAAVSTVGMLCGRPLSYALELAKKPKKEATEEYVHSTADLMATKGRPPFSLRRSFIVSNLSKLELSDVDYGWGKPLYFGPEEAGIHDIPGLCYYLPYTNSKGEHGTVVLICLPEDAMKRFENEINGILHIKGEDKPINSIMSNL